MSKAKIRFTSMRSLAHVLSEDNQLLLKLIIENASKSISDLEVLTGYKRKANNILRTLRTMEQYGLVKLEETPNKIHRGRAPLMPKALYDEFDVEFSIQQVC